MYIQNSIYDNFLEKIVNRANKIKLGSPMDSETQMGPLSSLKQLEIIEKNIKLTLIKVENLDVEVKDILCQIKDIIFLLQ